VKLAVKLNTQSYIHACQLKGCNQPINKIKQICTANKRYVITEK